MRSQRQRIALTPVLSVDELHVEVRRRGTPFQPAIAGISFALQRGQALGLVGESGCGKSLTLRTILGLYNPREVIQTDGYITYDGEPVPPEGVSSLRGKHIGFIPQDPSRALNPVVSIGRQVAEAVSHHQRQSRSMAWREAVRLLAQVGLPNPGETAHAYPHQLSGGQRQRALIAIALAGEPDVLFADEPTTALDVTVQAQVVALLSRLCRDHAMGLVFVSHDLALVSQICDRVAVIYAGRTVESGDVQDVLHSPQHPYTRALLSAMPSNIPPQQPIPYLSTAAPALGEWPEGCVFRTRCSRAQSACLGATPVLTANLERDHLVRCHFPGDSIEEEGSDG